MAPQNVESGPIKASAPGEPQIVKSQNRFIEAWKGAKVQAELLLKEIEALHIDEAEVKFGLTTVGEVGLFAVGKVGGEINYEVTLKWKKPSTEK